MSMAAASRHKKSSDRNPAPKKAPVSKTFVVIGFVLSTLFTATVTWWSNREAAKYQVELTDRAAIVGKFAETAQAFDGFVAALVRDELRGTVQDATRDAINANLREQRALLENARGMLHSDERLLADQYTAQLDAGYSALKTATGLLNTKPFVQAAANIAALRARLLEALKDG